MKSSTYVLKPLAGKRVALALMMVVCLFGGWASIGKALRPPPLSAMSTLQMTGSIFVVTTTGDNSDANTTDGLCNDGSGACTLRAALQQANVLAGADIITFNIPGTGPHIIQPATKLPTVTDPVIIDGTTQPGFTPSTPMIELKGNTAGSGAEGLRISAGHSTVAGLIINGFTDAGIELLTGGHNVISGNFLGTDATGSAPIGNFYGILVDGSSHNIIGSSPAGGGNLISGNQNSGVVIRNNAAHNMVSDNTIGTNVSGTAVIGNSDDGINLHHTSHHTITKNLVSGSSDSGIQIRESNTILVSHNLVGTTINGTAVLANNDDGIDLWRVSYLTITNNLLSGNGDNGLQALESSHLLITGNLIGTDVSGSVDFGNGFDGILFRQSTDSTIGGLTPAQRNLISGNGDDGIELYGSVVVTGNAVLGNYIGIDMAGLAALGNGVDGIEVHRATGYTIRGNLISGNGDDGLDAGRMTHSVVAGNIIGTNSSGTAVLANVGEGAILWESSHNTIGGTTAADRNLISGNGDNGLRITSATAVTGNVIQGNYLGTDITGLLALANGGDGLKVVRITAHTIGGAAAGAGNVLAGNEEDGLQMEYATNTLVAGNYVGLGADGATPLGNAEDGIYIKSSSSNMFGGLDSGSFNHIAHNGGIGIYIPDSISVQNSIQGNIIFNHAGPGIDLGSAGVTANDDGDGDTGANQLQNFPILTTANGNSTAITVGGSLNSTANVTHTLTFYSNSACDLSGYGEGETVLGFADVATDSTGNVNFMATLPISHAANPFVTATATDAAGSTSEFSACITATTVRTWEALVALTTPPIRGEYALAYDATRQVMVLYGGNATGWPYENSTWEFDGADWVEIATGQQPTAVYGMALAYDATRQEMLLFGGSNAADVALASTWFYTNTNWVLLTPATAPPARTGHALVYDATHGRILLFGGRDGETTYHDTWVYQAGEWSQLTTSTAPPARSHHALAYDQATQSLLLFGGQDAAGALLADTWSFALSTDTWSEVAASGPQPRQAHSMMFDPQTGVVVLVGGATSNHDTYLNDTWHYDSQSGWVAATQPAPAPATAYHHLLYDGLGQKGLLFTYQQIWQYQ